MANLHNASCTELIPLSSNICLCYTLSHKTNSRVHSFRLGSCISFHSVEKKKAETKYLFCLSEEKKCFKVKFQKIHLPNDFTFFVIMHLKTAWAWHTTPSALLNKTEEQMATDLYLQSGSACLRIFLFVKISLLIFKYFSNWNSWFNSQSVINIIIKTLTHIHIPP